MSNISNDIMGCLIYKMGWYYGMSNISNDIMGCLIYQMILWDV